MGEDIGLVNKKDLRRPRRKASSIILQMSSTPDGTGKRRKANNKPLFPSYPRPWFASRYDIEHG